jgi:diketogulonate reductase-like aldo/keto reductase
VNGRDHGYDRTRRGFEETLSRLGLDYLDLYLIHWPMPMRDRYVDTWRAFVAIHADGAASAIGVSNFTAEYLDRVAAETGVMPSVNQIQLNPGVVQRTTRAHAAEHGIVVQTWQPLARGETLLTEPLVREVAGRHGRSPAQVVLRWHLDQGLVPIPKSRHRDRLAANIDVFDFRLSPEDIDRLSELDGAEEPMDPATTELD